MVGALDLLLEAESPWWRSTEDRSALIGRLQLHLRGVQASELHAEWREFDSEELSVFREDPKLWAFGPHASLFGNAPVPDPLGFVTELADWIRARDLPTDVRDYCGGYTFAALAANLSQQTYAVMSAPLPVVDEAARLLNVRGVSTTTLTGHSLEPSRFFSSSSARPG